MKILISILLAFSVQFSLANESQHEQGKAEGSKTHKDWNEVFKQPVTDKSLSTPPEKTQIMEPAFMSQVKGGEVLLKWKAVEGAKFHLQVAKDPNYKWLVTDQPLVTYTEYSLKNLEPNQQYFWRVYTQKPENMKSYTKGPAVSSEFETVQ